MNIVSRFGAVALASALLLGIPTVASAETPSVAPQSQTAVTVSVPGKAVRPMLPISWLCRAKVWFCRSGY
ncbi:hypothetical protein [Actinomyces oricola]|uniref:hypothetical protein n=1 Tax=Actinomyces oricola TaxID=206043 RepID=UPI000FFF326E|nr:hypothetical protein [Actinomyces oricola]